jgi:hypothetical protein
MCYFPHLSRLQHCNMWHCFEWKSINSWSLSGLTATNVWKWNSDMSIVTCFQHCRGSDKLCRVLWAAFSASLQGFVIPPYLLLLSWSCFRLIQFLLLHLKIPLLFMYWVSVVRTCLKQELGNHELGYDSSQRLLFVCCDGKLHPCI